jgi:hypothetical protein
MKTTTVIVLKNNGSPFHGASVRLSFIDSKATEVTAPARADNKGVAVLAHQCEGLAEVFVNGRACRRYKLPGTVTIEWS